MKNYTILTGSMDLEPGLTDDLTLTNDVHDTGLVRSTLDLNEFDGSEDTPRQMAELEQEISRPFFDTNSGDEIGSEARSSDNKLVSVTERCSEGIPLMDSFNPTRERPV